MPKPLPAALGLALALAACEDGQPAQNVTAVRAANGYSDQLKAMSPLYRFLGLRRAIVDSGQRCKRVDTGAWQEDYRNMAMWAAHCTDTGDFAIFLAPNGDVQVRKCADSAQLKLPACKPLPAPDPAAEAALPKGKAKGSGR